MAIYQTTVDGKLKGKSDKSAFENTEGGETVLSFEKTLFFSYRKWRGSFHDLLEENQ